jgi:hypothetical protein
MAAGTKLLYEELHIGQRVFTTFDESEIVYGVIVNIEDISIILKKNETNFENTLNTELLEVYANTLNPSLEVQCQQLYPIYGSNTFTKKDKAVIFLIKTTNQVIFKRV